MQLGKLFFAALVVVVGFLMIVVGQELVQFLGIVVIMLGIGAALFTDMQKPSAPSQH